MKKIVLLFCFLCPVFSANAQLILKIDKVISPSSFNVIKIPIEKKDSNIINSESLLKREHAINKKEIELKHKMQDYYENNKSVKNNLLDIKKIQIILKEQEYNNNEVNKKQSIKEKELLTLEKILKDCKSRVILTKK